MKKLKSLLYEVDEAKITAKRDKISDRPVRKNHIKHLVDIGPESIKVKSNTLTQKSKLKIISNMVMQRTMNQVAQVEKNQISLNQNKLL